MLGISIILTPDVCVYAAYIRSTPGTKLVEYAHPCRAVSLWERPHSLGSIGAITESSKLFFGSILPFDRGLLNFAKGHTKSHSKKRTDSATLLMHILTLGKEGSFRRPRGLGSESPYDPAYADNVAFSNISYRGRAEIKGARLIFHIWRSSDAL